MNKLRASIKAIACFLVILITLSLSTITIYPFYKFRPYKMRKYFSWYISKALFLLSRILGIKVRIEGREKIPDDHNYLLICNHLGYLDILCVGQFMSLSFITSYEMRETSILGTIVELAGCVFVERRSEKRNKEKEYEDIESSLKAGVNIGLFPEATSTNGESVLPFKKSMFYPAKKLNIPILRSCLNYISVDGEEIDKISREVVCWHDDTDFTEHIWQVLLKRSIEVELKILDEISQPGELEVSEIVEQSHRLISDNFHPFHF